MARTTRPVEGSDERAAVRRKRMRVLLVSSSGGVLWDLLALEPWWASHDSHWVAVAAPDSRAALDRASVTWSSELVPRDVVRVPGALARAWSCLGRWRPELVVSAGTGIALPWLLAAKARRIPIVWVETYNMVSGLGRVARLGARLADLVLVQRAERLAVHRRARFVGSLH